jgi:hypothetical protein
VTSSACCSAFVSERNWICSCSRATSASAGETFFAALLDDQVDRAVETDRYGGSRAGARHDRGGLGAHRQERQ